jgi:PPP family 3-phenylpropionic acid transporter
MKQRSSLTARYSAVQGSFWMGFCVTISFAAVYLQGLGYSNASLGGILTVGNLLGALLGPEVSARIDRSERLSAWGFVWPWLLIETAILVVLIAVPVRGAVTSAAFALYVAFSVSLNSINLKLFVDCVHGGQGVDYGVARGMGSAAFVLASVVLGVLVKRLGVHVLPWAGLVMVALQALAHVLLRRGYAPAAVRGGQTGHRGRTMLAFLGENRRFTVLLLGAALIFFGHNTATNFLINVTRYAGGDESTLGALNGFMAAVEIPVMFFFGRIRGGRKSVSLLRVSLLFFALKAALLPLASSVAGIFGVFLLQAPSFALYTAVIVDYVAETVPFEDSAKAQSLAYSMTTVGAVLASLIAGRLYDLLTVPQTLTVAAAVTALGVLLALLGTRER